MVGSVGDRVSLDGNIGTITYVGAVDGTKGTWLGVEWDDPSRGKHDGVHAGRRYFTCRVPGAGSFIRPNIAGLSYGHSFIDALVSKYIDDQHVVARGAEKEVVMLGSSKGMIEVEAVGLDKVRARLANLDRLYDVSLDGEGVSSAGEGEDIRQKCRNIHTLDLSKCLIPSWDVVVMIVQQMEHLETLALNQNRFKRLYDTSNFVGTLSTVKDLHLNETLLDWDEILRLGPLFPNLQRLQLGYNRLSEVSSNSLPSEASSALQNLSELNLEGNLLSDWPGLLRALRYLPRLERLILSSNKFTGLPFPTSADQPSLPTLRHLSLSTNQLKDWTSMDALNAWIPTLAGLGVVETPILDDPDIKGTRQLLIGKLESLTLLNGTPITPAERKDSERFYLSYIAKTSSHVAEEQRRALHPRYAVLCELHGTPSGGSKADSKPDVLSSRLLSIHLAHLPSAPTSSTSLPPPPPSSTAPLRILPSMPLKALRVKALKTLKLPVRSKARLWACSSAEGEGEESAWVVEEMEGEGEVEKWGLREGDWVAVVLDE